MRLGLHTDPNRGKIEIASKPYIYTASAIKTVPLRVAKTTKVADIVSVITTSHVSKDATLEDRHHEYPFQPKLPRLTNHHADTDRFVLLAQLFTVVWEGNTTSPKH